MKFLPLAAVVRLRCALIPVAALALASCASIDPPSVAPETAASPVVERAPTPVAAAVPVPAAAASAPAEGASAPQEDAGPAVAPPIDELRPEVRIDLDDRAARVDLWRRVRTGHGISDLDNERVRKWERWYAERPDYVQRMTERGGRYLFHVMEEIDKRELPSELALLPFIESAFNPEALSRARASGMWQFMPATGRHFDLTQNVFRDDRRDVLASTRAALDYLTQLHEMFGDWHLALAAYNWGEGNVQRAQRANQRAKRGTGYENLRMPNETRDYVPKLQAVKNIVSDPERFGLTLPVLHNHPYFLSVPIARDIDVSLAARLADLPLDEFRALNPQMNKPVILAAGTPQVLLPYDNANTFVKSIGEYKGRLANWTAWVAPRTMKTAEAAREVGMSEAELREVNGIPPRMIVKAGSTLVVPRNGQRQGDVSERVAENATIVLAREGGGLRRVSLRVGKGGDSVAAVARRHGVSAEQVAQWNNLSPGARLKPGSTVVVYVQPRPTAKGAGKATSHKSTSKAAGKSRSGAASANGKQSKATGAASNRSRPVANKVRR